MTKGKFITFEGCERVGKTTQLQRLKRYLELSGQDGGFVFTKEPGGTPTADKIRALILDKENTSLTAKTEALLYAASRAQHVEELILPALESGRHVICDRYFDSSVAYQVYGRGLPYEYVRSINSYALENCSPDYTVFFDLHPDNAFNRRGAADRIELESAEFHRRVYEGFCELYGIEQCSTHNARAKMEGRYAPMMEIASSGVVLPRNDVPSTHSINHPSFSLPRCALSVEKKVFCVTPAAPDETHKRILDILRKLGVMR